MKGLIRKPAVAGLFYASDERSLLREIEWSFKHPVGPGKLPEAKNGKERLSLGYVSPHAGYIYSGPVAAHVFYGLAGEKPPQTIVLIGTNHTGLGEDVSLGPWSEWETPLGRIKVDAEVRDHIIRYGKTIKPDYLAHLYEHSVEVQLPFIQYVYKGSDAMPLILPIVVMDHRPTTMQALAEELLEAMTALSRDFVIIASTDLNHYDPHEVTLKKDERAIRAILDLDADSLYKAVFVEGVTMCGPGGVMVLIYLAKKLTGRRPVILKHATSGDTSGDKKSTVGYLAAAFPR